MLKVKEKRSGKKALLDSSDSEEETVKVKEEFTINKNYADRYDNWRNLEETQKLKNKLGINDLSELKDDESSSESSSEEEEDWSMEKEKAFLKTLACLKTKNPKIYSDQFGFFKGVEDVDDQGSGDKKKKNDKKAFTVRDHERVMVLEKGMQLSDEEDEKKPKIAKSYPEELASIKTEFSKALKDIDSSDDDDGDNLLGSNLLKARTSKSENEQKQEDAEYKLWLKGELDKVEKGKLSKDDEKELKSLRDYWNDDKLDEGEKFLRDYILNKKYIDPLEGEGDYIPTHKEIVNDLSDDEKFEEEREVFEHKYNFRFEEPDQEFIKRYPRTIQESMRREDTSRTSRKDQRQKAKERKEEQKARMKEEVQRLKALKRKEIMSKISKLQEVTGDPDLFISEMDIDGDFDPDEHDRRMKEIFDEDYYEEAEDTDKPVFDYDEEIDGENEDIYENWVPVREKAASISEEEEESELKEEENEADQIKDTSSGRKKRKAESQKELIEASKGKRGRRKRSKFLEVLEREKPKFDPEKHKSFEKYFDEYYSLDFEDVVGDLKCRFKYHKTTPNDFGLTTDEILKADDKELNQWASLKKTFQYRGEDEEEYEVKAYKQKGEREDLKKKLLLSVYQPGSARDDVENDGQDTTEKPKKRKKKNKKGKRDNSGDANGDIDEVAQVAVENSVLPDESVGVDKKKKKKKDKSKSEDLQDEDQAHVAEPSLDISDKPPKQKKKRSAELTVSEDKKVQEELTGDKKKKKKDKSLTISEVAATVTVQSPAKSPKIQKDSHLDTPSNSFSNGTSKQNPSATPGLSKRQRKNLKRLNRSANGEMHVANGKSSNVKTISDNPKAAKDKKHRDKPHSGIKRKAASVEQNGTNLDEDRLQAYGLNPKKFKKQMKYGKSAVKS